MALLTEAKRKEYFKFLGLGEYNKANIKKFQKTAFPKLSKEWDGVYGTKTDYALRHWRNVKKFTKNFSPEEFKCECGGKHCTGYPSWMKKVELQNLQSIRSHYGKPMKITSGLRCKTMNNKSKGSINTSKHLTGYAADFYMSGVTDTLAHRKSAIKYIKTLPNHGYTYGNGYNSNGVAIKAAYMGNALHTDTNKPPAAPKPVTPLTATAAPAAGSTAAQKIVANAAAYCWPYGTAKKKYAYSGGSAKSAYKKALKKHMGKEAKISRSDCGYFVSTCVRAAGLGKFKALPGKATQSYPKLPSSLKIVHKGKAIPNGLLQPGDIIRYRKNGNKQHTMMYFGDGKIAEANRKNCFPAIKKDTKKYNAAKVKKSTIQVIRAK